MKILSVVLGHHPAFKYAIQHCSRDTSKDATNKKNENIVEENGYAADGVDDAEDLACQPSAITISQGAGEGGGYSSSQEA